MKKIITNNGTFCVTDSLYESIKLNNPELLENDVSKKQSKKNINDAVKTILTSLDTVSLNNEQKERIYHYINQKTKKNNKSIKIDTADDIKKLVQDCINKKGNEDLKEIITDDVINKINSTQVNQIKKIVQPKNQNNKSNVFSVSDVDSQNIKNDSIYMNITDVLKDEKLKQEIQDSEKGAEFIIKRSKEVIQRYTGVWGSNILSKHTSFNNSNTQTPANTNQNNTLLKAESLQLTDSMIVEDEQIANDNQIQNNGQYQNKTKFGQAVKGNLQLATGGFLFEPMFKTIKDTNASKALKYYAAALKFSAGSHIKWMINTMITFKNDAEEYQNAMKEDPKNPNSSKSVEKEKGMRAFENLCFSYLRNVTTQLEINGEQEYRQIINVIRMDPKLYERYDIHNINTIQVLDAKETVITFVNKVTHIVDMIMVVSPLFARGKELAKNAKATWDIIKKHNKL